MKIEVSVRLVYGKPLIYPVNEAAKVLASIAKVKSLSLSDLANARLLGFEVVEVFLPMIKEAA